MNPASRPTGTTPTGSRIDVFQFDTVVTLTGEFNWKSDPYKAVVKASVYRTGVGGPRQDGPAVRREPPCSRSPNRDDGRR